MGEPEWHVLPDREFGADAENTWSFFSLCDIQRAAVVKLSGKHIVFQYVQHNLHRPFKLHISFFVPS